MNHTQGTPKKSRKRTPLRQKNLLRIYRSLLSHFGPQHWWPAETRFEVIVGAILTQNTAWSNVERAIGNLKAAHAMGPEGLRNLPLPRLLQAIRPSGYFNIKAARIQHFLDFLYGPYQGNLEALLRLPTDLLREELLHIRGIGPETADSIILYAAERPLFVIDAYTLRVMTRHGHFPEGIGYEEAQHWFMRLLPPQVDLFKEYHALLVAVGKRYCRTRPYCQGCPLENS